MRNLWLCLIALFLIAGCATQSPAPIDSKSSDLPFAQVVSQNSDTALDIVVQADGAEAVAGSDCSLKKAEVDEFNALLELDAEEVATSQSRNAPYGLADSIPPEIVLTLNEYVIIYDPDFLVPTYTTYRLDAKDVESRTRENCFREDPRLEENDRSTLADYAEPIFDRGHLVPRADMNRSRSAMINTFVLSNMMPQHDNFNQGVWQTFESTIRAWAKEKGSIVVISGPVFDSDGNGARDDPNDVTRMRPRNKVGVPSHFFKIAIHQQQSGYIEAIAVLLPHTDDEVPKNLTAEEELAIIETNITSIDQIEALTGVDFFPNMPEPKQRAVERSIATGLWH